MINLTQKAQSKINITSNQTLFIVRKMEHVEYEQQQPLHSISQKQKNKLKDFKKYLVESGTMMHFVKFLLGVRNKQIADDYVPTNDPIAMFTQYFGKIQPDTKQQDALRQKIAQERQQNQQLKTQLDQVKKAIKFRKDQIARKLQEKRLRQEQQAKNPKKGKK